MAHFLLPSLDLPWTRAELEARKLFLSGHTSISIEAGDKRRHVVLRVDSRFVGRETESRLVVDRRTGATRVREKVQHGSKPYRKTYRFEPGVVHEHRIAPRTPEERERGREHWTKIQETEHRIPAGCHHPIHPEALFWVLATAAPQPGDPPLERCAFTGDGFARLSIEALDRREEPIEFEQDGEIPRIAPGRLEVLRLSLDGRALDGAAAEEIDFLGLEGTIGLDLDAQTGAPVRVTGNISPLGTIVVKLQRLTP